MSDEPPLQQPVVRDKRRIDPSTGEVRRPADESESSEDSDWTGYGNDASGDVPEDGAGEKVADKANAYEQAAAAYGQHAGPPAAPVEAESSGDAGAAPGVEQQLAERTADLQRVQAEYANYRRRVERDREAVREQAMVNVLGNLLPLLDDISRARDHGDLTGGFKSVGEALEATVEKLGLVRFGEAGDSFDPVVHEALTHSYSADVTEATAVAVLQPGYRLGERLLRPARVAVAEPEQ